MTFIVFVSEILLPSGTFISIEILNTLFMEIYLRKLIILNGNIA